MKKRFLFHIGRCLILAISLMLPAGITAQEAGSCAEKLQTAQSLFDRGQVEQVAGLLHDCLESGFNREEALTAYKLIIQTYLFEDELEKADSAMLAFLRKNPEYQLSETDHSSFVHLFNNFQVNPVIQVSLRLGTNMPFTTFKNLKPVDESSPDAQYSAGALNLYGGLEARFRLKGRFDINAEAAFSQITFSKEDKIMDIGTAYYKERQSRIEVPVSVIYNFRSFGQFTPYVRLGAGPSFLISSVATANFDAPEVNGQDISGPDIDRKDARITMDIFGQAGAGIKLKTRGGYIFAEARSNLGVFNQTVREDLLSETNSSSELNTYRLADDDFNINTLNFSIGYTQIFYKPFKKKE